MPFSIRRFPINSFLKSITLFYHPCDNGDPETPEEDSGYDPDYGLFYGTVSSVSGKVNSALKFEPDATGRLSCQWQFMNGFPLEEIPKGTLSFWFKFKFADYDVAPDIRFAFIFGNITSRVNSASSTESSDELTDDTWYFFHMTWDYDSTAEEGYGANAKFYLNNEYLFDEDSCLPTYDTRIAISGSSFDNGSVTVDDIRVFKAIVPDMKIIYNEGDGREI